jgi:uncharacterized membrane protein (UPF0182 family)
MQSNVQSASVSKASLWAGRSVSTLIAAFMVFDGVMKVMKLAPAVEGTVRLGYPVSLIVAIGVVCLVCAVLYAIPRTSILGATLLTGYFGGAAATQVRVENPWFLFPVVLGVLAWLGLFLRDDRLRLLVPLRSSRGGLGAAGGNGLG